MAVTKDHFKRAAQDIGAHGDNDTLPFDVDSKFIAEKADDLATIASAFYESIIIDSATNNDKKIKALNIFSERLLVPAGPAGFRITTKIHPFWNVYFNGLGIAIAENLEPDRSIQAGSYRFLVGGGEELFDRSFSWRAFREASVADCERIGDVGLVTQTDISSFYEHVSHHYIENLINDRFRKTPGLSKQVNALLSKFSAARSFGLPVGGQCSRILAELFLNQIDASLNEAGLTWRRYVDDYVLITKSNTEAYRALSGLSHALADYGITLSKTKTMVLTKKHYEDYVRTQLEGVDEDVGRLREIDLRFDPYSDNPVQDYESLRQTVEGLEIDKLLNRELAKAQPDTFLISQIGRTLRLQPPKVAAQLCQTLLSHENLHAFRASWSTIMRGVAALRGDQAYEGLFEQIDNLLDAIPGHSPHLIYAEASLLHYLRAIRFGKTQPRAGFVRATYDGSLSKTVRRACINCWRIWGERQAFNRVRNRWNEISPEEQRMLWLAAYNFDDEGQNFHRQNAHVLENSWRLGIERQGVPTFTSVFREWCDEAHLKV